MSTPDDALTQAIADNAAVGAYLASLVPVPPPVPPPTPAPVYLFDGRATTQGALPVSSGSGNNVTTQPPTPTGVWVGTPHNGGYLYDGSDATSVPDPTGRFERVYRYAPAAGRHNPYWTTATPNITSAQLNKVRPLVLGETCWYADAVYLDSITYPSWGTYLSLGYQTILYDQVQLGPRRSNGGQSNVWTIQQVAGLAQSGRAAVQYVQTLKPATTKMWTDWIMGYTAATDASGLLEVHYRPDGGTWSQVWRKTGPTLVWTNATGTPQVGTELNDKEGLYYGWDSQTQTPAPTGVTLSRGLSRHPSLADALASLG